MYATITQSRGWLPDEVGGLVWLAQDNVATSIYVPLYCSITDLPQSYKTPGRTKGYTRDSAWWAFNRLSTLASQRWGDTRKDLEHVWVPMQQKFFTGQKATEERAVEMLAKDREAAQRYLTNYSASACNAVVSEAWRLGDYLWTKYDEKF
jgi:dipeptidase